MDLYNIAKRLSKLVPDNSNVSQIYSWIHTNKTLNQFTSNFPKEVNIKLSFFIDALKRNIDRRVIEWSVNNNLYVFDVICFGKHPGEIDCPNCKGGTYIECINCEGDGSTICPDCGGDGNGNEDSEDEYCELCDGTGYETCDICAGDGKRECNRCLGDGTIDDNENIPEITVTSYITYDLNLESKLEEMIGVSKDVSEMPFFNQNYPAIMTIEQGYNSKQINAFTIPLKNWDSCFINDIYEYQPEYFIVSGQNNRSLKRKNQDIYYINENLT